MSKLPTWPFIIIAALIGILGTFAVRRYIAFQNASTKFREAILNELGDIYPNPVNWPKDSINIEHLLKSKFTNLQTAVEQFRRALPWFKRKDFENAWLRYRCSTGREIDIQCYHHYMPFISTSIVNGKEVTIDNSKTYKETFKHNVDTLLKFAKKT
jgi:hypothetical protein